MTTIAHRVYEAVQGAEAISFYAGYAVKSGVTVRFAQGHQELCHRNDKGRCIHARYRYADDSTLTYLYDAHREVMTLQVKSPPPRCSGIISPS